MDLQKSQLGFLQALLHKILSQRPSLINLLFSPYEQMQAVARLRNEPGSECLVWSINELRRAIRKWRDNDDSGLYLHVDGIDEIDCEPLELAHLLNELSAYPKVKILAAGRYHPDFDFCIEAHKKLNIHELTEPDILQFIIDTMNQPQLWALLSPGRAAEEFAKVVREIVLAAQGVFQWVSIVAKSLVQGMRRFEKFDRLFSRLQEYPKDLDDLYRFLYLNIEARYASDAAFWLLTVFYARTTTSLETYYVSQAEFYDKYDTQWLATRIRGRRTGKSEESRTMQQRIQTQCPHFFDMNKTKIKFAHLTILDFLVKNEKAMIQELSLHLAPGKSPRLSDAAISILSDKPKYYRRDLNFRKYFEVCCHTTTVHLYTLLKQGVTDDVILLWEQLKACTKFRVDNGSHSTSTLMPTSEGWVRETMLETVDRLHQLEGKMLHAITLFARIEPHTLCKVQETASILNLDHGEREMLLLEWDCDATDDQIFKIPEGNLGLKYADFVVSKLFPSGVAWNCFSLQRLLELTRAGFIGSETEFVTHPI